MKEHIKQVFQQALPMETVRESISWKRCLELRQFSGSTPGLLLSEVANESAYTLVVTPDVEKAAAIASDLGELLPGKEILIFPPTHKKPYDKEKLEELSASIQRSEVLEKLKNLKEVIVIASADAIGEKIIPADIFQAGSLSIKDGMNIPPDSLREQLTEQGYEFVKFVDEPGEFAVRGGIFDVFPWSAEYPVRLEFFGDEIDSIREFDPDSQRSVAFLNDVRFVPSASLENGGPKESLFSYLPKTTLCMLLEPGLIHNEISRLYSQAVEFYEEHPDQDLPPPDHGWLSPEIFTDEVKEKPLLLSGSFMEGGFEPDDHLTLASSPHPSFNGSFKLLRQFIKEQSKKNTDTLILCENQNQRERFEELLGEADEEFRYRIGVFTLHEGFILTKHKLCVLTDHQIFNRYHRPKIKKGKSVRGGISFKELKELNVGDYVVHVDYGIGKFNGFKKISVKDAVQESAVIRYKEDSLLYVNVSSLHKIQKYSGKEGNAPQVTRLGSGEWAKKKQKTRSRVKDIARELITLYAKRKAQEAYHYSPDTSWQMEMEARFEFEETPDQQTAIESVKADMESAEPMDRLVCGDVGFGKTEVAIRAAFKAVMDQKQVAVLVPTTILADQHYKTFAKRMADFPVNVEVISRFRSTAEQKDVLRRLEAGKVDILIGTHRLVSKDVKFKELGLLIVDEEQRFGVSVKEKLKAMRTTIDVLTLTATPIPRTMQFSLMGARDLSIINTAPTNRQPVYTEIHSFSHELIRDAILRETSRGGQIFFIHNRVQNIESVAELIRQLVPDIRVRTGHGQMTSTALEKIVHDFYNHRFDVLVSTNIVENGIDISNANTIIINNANHFGLSELHQLRGRVGRSLRKAFCYLLTPPVQQLSSDARKRLQALVEFSDLGAGFNIAMRDLDIRGAGDILGAEQSGFVNELGFELYTKILDDAMRELKQEEFGDLFKKEDVNVDFPETQVEFDSSALLETGYVADNVERLNLYRKLAAANTEEEISGWEDEVQDRFGPLPASAQNLLLAAAVKLLASRLYISKVTVRSGRIWLVCPREDTPAGSLFYAEGQFQKLLSILEERNENSFKVTEKKKKLRIVIDNVQTLSDARELLRDLNLQLKAEVAEA